MMRFACFVLVVFAVAAFPVRSQTPKIVGQPDGEVSRFLSVEATQPLSVQCDKSRTCFRVVFQIRPQGDREIELQSLDRENFFFMTQGNLSTGITSTGAICYAAGRGGLPRARLWSDGRVEWNGAPFRVSPAKRGLFVVEFNCDGPTIAGDEVSLQLTLAVDSTGRGPKIARYVFPVMPLGAPK